MSDWAAIRQKKKVEKEKKECVNFVYEGQEEDLDDDDDEPKVVPTPEKKPVVEEKPVVEVTEEKMKQIVDFAYLYLDLGKKSCIQGSTSKINYFWTWRRWYAWWYVGCVRYVSKA